jgi:CheY-like chemotaxis protein
MMMGVVKKPVKILLVEDNLADARLIESLLERCRFPVQVKVAWNGEEAMHILGRSAFPGREDPDLVLLDLNLPRLHGFEVLSRVKTDPNLKHIPILVVSGSENERDEVLARENLANGYIVKAKEVEDLGPLLRQIEDFWFGFKGGTA